MRCCATQSSALSVSVAKNLLAASGSLLLAACATLPAPTPDQAQAQPLWRARVARLSAIEQFSLQGRVAEHGLGGARGDLSWSQNRERFEVRVSGPLGVGALLIAGVPDAVEIRNKEGVFETADPAAFMVRQLGWSLPVAKLRWWVLGLPAPDSAPQLLLDESGRASKLAQDGWEIDYAEYQSVGSLSLPRAIELADGERRFRLIVDQWSEIAAPAA